MVITPLATALRTVAARAGRTIQLICDRSRFHPPPPVPPAPDTANSLPSGGEAGRGTSTPSRGIRNCNPGNIRGNSKSSWEGLDPNRSDPSFCCFVDATYGIRAMVYLIRKYQMDGYSPRCASIRDIIARWAPPSENNVSAYLTDVAGQMKPRTLDSLSQPETVAANRDTLTALVKAIIHHENGEQPYGADVIAQGVQRGLDAHVTIL